MNFESAYNKCREIATAHYENFPVGSFLFPEDKRKYIYAIYAFARNADDIADSGELSENEKLEKLDSMRKKLDLIESNQMVEDDIFFALSDTIHKLEIPVQEFKNLLTAFEQDSVKQRYEKFDELIEYSGYSANPIGHLVLYVSGIREESMFKFSDYVCTALQLANFWQDVSRDLDIGRIYIPKEEMEKHNYSYELLFQRKENKDFVSLIKSLVDRTKLIFENGKELEIKLSGRLKYEFRTMYRGGILIIKKIEKINYNVLSKRVKIDFWDKLNMLLKIFIKI